MTNDRYRRQMVLPEIGASGQALLARASVLVIGAGGLGSAVLQALAGAGVGCLTVVDHDRVEESNLHRQPLYRMADIGSFKVRAAKAALAAYNPDVVIMDVTDPLTPANVAVRLAACDLVIDGADSFAVTYTLSDRALIDGKPLISASVLGFGGYVGGFCAGAPSYRAVFPSPPDQTASCATAGVIGPAVALLGALQAQMALTQLLGLAPSPLGRLLTLDLASFSFGGFTFHGTPEPEEGGVPFIAPEAVGAQDLVVDLRSLGEAPVSAFTGALRLTPDEIGTWQRDHGDERRIVLCCRSGLRAWRAAETLKAQGKTNLALVALG